MTQSTISRRRFVASASVAMVGTLSMIGVLHSSTQADELKEWHVFTSRDGRTTISYISQVAENEDIAIAGMRIICGWNYLSALIGNDIVNEVIPNNDMREILGVHELHLFTINERDTPTGQVAVGRVSDRVSVVVYETATLQDIDPFLFAKVQRDVFDDGAAVTPEGYKS